MADRKPTVLNPAGYQENLQAADNLVVEATPTTDFHVVNRAYLEYLQDNIDGNIDLTDKWSEGSGALYPATGTNNVLIGGTLPGTPAIQLNADGTAVYTNMVTALSFSGPSFGDVTGDLTGNVTGNLTGDVTGAVTGDVTGNLTGDVTGDVTGNLTGSVSGPVTGDVTGNLTGNVSGDLTGDVTGNVTGNVNGNVTGDVTGNVTGNADTATRLANQRSIGLSGDVSGSANFDGSADITISATVADDSHNHVIGNVDGLQAALDGKLGTGAKAADADKLDGQDSSYYRNASNLNSGTISDSLLPATISSNITGSSASCTGNAATATTATTASNIDIGSMPLLP